MSLYKAGFSQMVSAITISQRSNPHGEKNHTKTKPVQHFHDIYISWIFFPRKSNEELGMKQLFGTLGVWLNMAIIRLIDSVSDWGNKTGLEDFVVAMLKGSPHPEWVEQGIVMYCTHIPEWTVKTKHKRQVSILIMT